MKKGKKNYYEILEIDKSADSSEIKRSYKKLVLEWHPDRNLGSKDAEEKFKQINLAYEVLSDEEKRRSYDLGLSFDREIFDPSKMFDPDFLRPEEFIKTFVTFFGDYLDETVPGGFRDRVHRAADNVNKSKKRASENTDGAKCKICKGKGRIKLIQGSLAVHVDCQACSR